MIGVIFISFGFGRAYQHKFRENGGIREIGIGVVLAIISAFMKW